MLKSRTINSALNEDAKNVCGALNICTKSLRIVKSHASALMLSIIDNVTGDKETIEVKVTDCYLAYVINDSNYPILPAGTTLF